MSTIDPESWQHLRTLLDRALDLEGAERSRFLDELRAASPDAHAEVEQLLAASTSTILTDDESIRDAAAAVVRESGALDESLIGRTIGPYRVRKLLGMGGAGAVYLADRSTEDFTQQVALKVIRGGLASASAHERFELERRILARLVHPNIAALLDGGHTGDGAPFYTMEYVDGVPITRYCREHVHSVAGRVRLLLQVAAALTHAHQHLIVHRDIKPSNILVRADGCVKLVDFGIAKTLGETAERGITKLGRGPMTPEYAAPEQFLHRPVSAATDVYQFGCVCYHVLTGSLPYRADPDDPVQWARAVTEDEPTRTRAALLAAQPPAWRGVDALPRIRRQLSGDLEAILRKSMAKEPDDRYRSMDAMAADLEAFLESRPVGARRPGFWYFAARLAARQPYTVGGAAIAVVALALTAVIALHQARIATTEAARARSAIGFVADMFKVADPGVNRGAQLSANMVLARGSHQLRSVPAEQPALRGSLAALIANVYITLGDMKRALPLLEQAIVELRRDDGGERLALPTALERGAFVALRAGRVRKAIAWLAEAERSLGQPRRETADIWSELLSDRFTIAFESLEPDAALEIAQRAVTLAQRFDGAEPTVRTALALQHLSYALADVARNAEAIDAGERAREIFERLFGRKDLRSVRADEGVAYALVNAQRFDLAQAKLDRAAQAYRASVGEQSYRYAVNLYNRARLLLARGEADAARTALLEAARIVALVSADNAALRGRVLHLAGRIELDTGRVVDGIEHLTEVDLIFAETLAPDSLARIELWTLLAHANHVAGHEANAVHWSERAIRRALRGLPESREVLARAVAARMEVEPAS